MAAQDKIVGVIGGMGPEATVDFMAKVIALTPANRDQQHIRMLVEHNPKIPNRQRAILGESASPGPVIAAMAQRLQMSGADLLVMPCNLAHAWHADIDAATNVPFVSIVNASIEAAIDVAGGSGKIGLMTTPGCFAAQLYQNRFAELDTQNVLQTQSELQDAMELVNRVKGGDHSPAIREQLQNLANALLDRGATVIVAACTEFPLLLDQSMFAAPFISSTDALARKTVALALAD